MRKEFSQWIEDYGRRDPRLIFLTGDLGFMALEKVQASLGHRFINMGVCEQNMVSVAAGLAQQGMRPLCYSIASFAVFRPYEQIRLDVALHRLSVKIVGNGGGYGYGIMGPTHHALEDLAALSCLPNFRCVVPVCNSDVAGAAEALFPLDGPGYLRLGLGVWPDELGALPEFRPIRRLVAARVARPKLTIVGLGPVLLNVLPWVAADASVDVFAVSQLPLTVLDDSFLSSVADSRQLLVIEEHVARGGMGEHVAAALVKEGVAFKMYHRHAVGYPNGCYGSQAYHQTQSGLDAVSLKKTVTQLRGSI
ncbi:MAG: transketolase C-terminal domain-containing protein [Lacunisphaera sp.]